MRAVWVVLVVACSSPPPAQPPHTETVDEQLKRELADIHGSDAHPPDVAPPMRPPDPEPTACPASAAEATGQCVAGNVNHTCRYPPSTVCSCTHEAPPCSPVNHDDDPTEWVCTGPPPPPTPPKPRTDGCPASPPKGACRKPKQDCAYEVSCCSEHFICTAGTWTFSHSACPK